MVKVGHVTYDNVVNNEQFLIFVGLFGQNLGEKPGPILISWIYRYPGIKNKVALSIV